MEIMGQRMKPVKTVMKTWNQQINALIYEDMLPNQSRL